MTEDEVVDVVLATDRMARRIGYRFVLDDSKLEAWLTGEQIDRVKQIRRGVEVQRSCTSTLEAHP